MTIRTPHAIWPTAIFHCWDGINHYSLSWLFLMNGDPDILEDEDTGRVQMGIPSMYW